ncbi:DUF2892 domain-containing protein [Candidatus Falkowbacteria bacterium]|uniref:Inner membrane protein YgaP-like transmembrane domain-containing protein n=1 Tax=Candidatus Falkowbacteria bacterium CG10_big_fil_rev_8_21_14_0_10_37_18 TaxID=1974562 RepID=A0A2H0V8K8_9BACT|nr:DUF2892 domain-containing protein [Candidatus Falkowbacteria bacterium]NCQ12766.1 DUF2892 domain-containing protein [Candidatus Falkowbacteria bacterium]OIO06144.1 MAG: hypothetical protein AUJ26_01410 [Candidatus Falkowbacteria bacterium CG1_02_37_21]PIR95447.1 MAG: hypothetical protein COT93_02385 [Candidatus Falkowbacteria bacterium CG10_big_fil_rev_8_21_14_0_10_37_18]
MYQKNEGMLDRLIRVILGEVFFILAWFWLGGSFQTIAYILSAVMLITAITGFCGLYKIFGINTNNNKKYSKVIWSIFAILFLAVAIVGSYYSSFFTKKLFLEDYNVMNNYYKQTLFNTGQDNRLESIANYDKLVIEYRNFTDKYSNYHPQVIAKDKNFNSDLVKVKNIIAGLKNEVYVGDLKDSHLSFEEIRPIFQDILKRNGFSMLAVYLVDFHDSMEKVIEEADNKNTAGVIITYTEASDKLLAIEEVANDDEIKAIRNNLETLLNLAQEGKMEGLSDTAAKLKSSFIKVYLQRG